MIDLAGSIRRIYTRIGAPVGASISADIAIVTADIGVIIDEVVATTGTYSYDETSALELTAFTVALTARARVGSIWLDFVNVTQDVTIRLYHQIDGTTMREIAEYDYTVATDSDGVEIAGFTARDDFRITLQCAGSGGGSVNIPYAVE